jgi:hypothetical protein
MTKFLGHPQPLQRAVFAAGICCVLAVLSLADIPVVHSVAGGILLSVLPVAAWFDVTRRTDQTLTPGFLLALAVILTIATEIATGLLMNVLGERLDKTGWSLWLASESICLNLYVLAGQLRNRSRGADQSPRQGNLNRLSTRRGTLLCVGGTVLLAGAVYLAFRSSEAAVPSTASAIWIAPASSQRVKVYTENESSRTETYRILFTSTGQAYVTSLTPGSIWVSPSPVGLVGSVELFVNNSRIPAVSVGLKG